MGMPAKFTLPSQNVHHGAPSRNIQHISAAATTRLHPPSKGALIKDDPPPIPSPLYPRNWPSFPKWTTYTTICLFTFLANVNASCFTVAVLPLASTLHVSTTKATWLTNFNVLMFGLGNLLWVPLMRIVGKRPVFLLAIAVLIAANLWSFKAETWASLLAARMVSGLGAAAADAIVPAVVRELWPRSEAAGRLMWFHFALVSGIFLGPLINAWVVQEVGWRWIPGWLAVAFGTMFVFVCFLVRETSYHVPFEKDREKTRRSYVEWLGLGICYTPERPTTVLTQVVKDLFAMVGYLPILFAAAVIGIFVGWTIIIQITAGQGFSKPPHHWNIGYIGLFHISAWLGSLPAVFFGGTLVDWIASHKHEPSSHRTGDEAATQPIVMMDPPHKRLSALAIPFIFGPPGLLMYGIMMTEHQPWIGPAFGYAFHSFAFNAAGNISITYAAEFAGMYSAEAMVTLFVIRNVIATLCSFFCNGWIERNGQKNVFIIMAVLEWVAIVLGVAVYVFHGQVTALAQRFGPLRRVELARVAAEEGNN